MPLAEANHQTQPDHPSWMPLVKANQQLNQHFIIGLTFINNSTNIHSQFNIHRQLNQHFIVGLTFVNNSINIS